MALNSPLERLPAIAGQLGFECSVAIALGANTGAPSATLMAVRPLLEAELLAQWQDHAAGSNLVDGPAFHWSPLFRTAPVGGPSGQPPYLNAALLATFAPAPLAMDPTTLLDGLQALEDRFGRQRGERWGARSLDLDLLWCGDHRIATAELQLPHPRLHERSFVLAPLAAIDPHLKPPQPMRTEPSVLTCAELLAVLQPCLSEPPPERLAPRPGWPE